MNKQTYNQPTKEKSRKEIWQHAIGSLTYNRQESTIVNVDILNELICECVKGINNKYTNSISNKKNSNQDWIDFHNSVYPVVNPNQLRVAFFCGPEPLNDLKHLLDRGLRAENIWAFEMDKENYKIAEEELKKSNTYINLYGGNIDDYIMTTSQRFDVVYLDFTNNYLSKNKNPLMTLNKIFDSNFLNDLSNVIINTCYPDEKEDNIKFLRSFFNSKKWVHRSIYGREEGSMFHESFFCNNIFNKKIDLRFNEAYSDFSTAIPDLFANVINPMIKILKQSTLKKKIFKLDKVEEVIKRLSEESNEYNPDNYSYWLFVNSIISSDKNPLYNYFTKNIVNQKFNPFTVIKFYSLIHSIDEGYFDVFSDEVYENVSKIDASIIEKQIGPYLFCDIPMKNLWYSLIIGKYGYPYHINYNNHKRFDYVAKERKMCLDVFTFDRCRSLYDYVPSFEFMSEFMSNIDKQLIVRCYIDKIYKTQFYYNDSYYQNGHIFINGETKHSFITEVSDRIHLQV